jgi:poly(rC)-binding protein 3/4
MAADSNSDRSASPQSSSHDGSNFGSGPTITLRFLVNSREAGSIIGKKGDNVKKLREESGAKVSISDSSSIERIASVTGSSGQVVKAFNMICDKFEEDTRRQDSSADSSYSVTFRLIVPNVCCGSLIGKSGANIKELRELTGASVQVANDMLPNSTERSVTISGTTHAVMQCIQRLCSIVAESKPSTSVIPYQPQLSSAALTGMFNGGGMGVRPQMGGMSNMGGNRGGMSKGPSQQGIMGDVPPLFSTPPNLFSGNYPAMLGGFTSSRSQTQEIIVPNEIVGTIIGKQGSTINEIRQHSQAMVKIADAEEGSKDRKVIITGSPAGISAATYLINTIRAKYESSPTRV